MTPSPPAAPTLSATRSTSTPGWLRARLPYLRVVRLLVQRDLKVKYRGTVLGYLWSMLNPLLFMIVLSFVFSHFVKGIEHYPLFVLAGILSWNMCAQSLSMGAHSLVGNANLLKKVRLPYWVFALVPLGSTCVNFLLALVPYTILSFAQGRGLHWQIALLPLVLGLFLLFLAGLTVALACLNVFFRDVGHVLEPILSILFYATPVIYDRSSGQFSPTISRLLGLNPFVHFIEGFRACLFGNTHLGLGDFGILSTLAVASLATGMFVYARARRRIIFSL